MYKNYFLIAPLILFLCSTLYVNAQQIDPSMIEDLSPDQIALAAGLYKDRNESDNNPKDSTEEKDLSEKKDTVDTNSDIKTDKDSLEEIKDKLNLLNFRKSISDSSLLSDKEKASLLDDEPEEEPLKFGYDFFKRDSSLTDITGDLPLPNDYQISLNDKFSFILSGSKRSKFDAKVKLDGTILFPDLGSISVAGETLGEVKKKIDNLVNEVYIGVDVNISLSDLSAKKISIVGAVESPGTYLVNPFSSITSALSYSGGILEIGSLRSIKLLKTNGDILNFDLYDLLIDGDRSKDVTVDAGDVILIESANKFTNLKGAVNRPAIYEIKEGEDLEDLINFGMGFKDNSNLSKVSISSLNIRNSSIDQLETNDLDISLKNVITVEVYEYNNEINSGILVSGSVSEPGYYDIDSYPELADLISELKFVNTYPFLAVLEQFDQDSLLTSSILFNLNDPNTYDGVKLQKNAKVYFLEILDLENYRDTNIGKEYAPKPLEFLDLLLENLGNQVLKSTTRELIKDYLLTINHKDSVYKMPVYGYYSINSFIDYLGLDMTNIDKKSATYINPVEDFISVGDYRNMSFVSKRYHNISFRSPQNTLINIKIDGEVKYPGNFTLNNGASLGDLYKLVGGFNDTADTSGVVIKRESIAIMQKDALEKAKNDLNSSLIINSGNKDNNIDPAVIASLSMQINEESLGRIAGDYSPNNSEALEFILLNNDTIFIPKKTNTLNILGEVLNPNAFPFSESIDIKDAINLAGGVKDFADVKNIYIIHANGLISRSNRNIFSGRSINLAPGDTIVVPRKIEIQGRVINNITAFTQIISDIAFSAAALQSLQSTNSQ